MENSNVPAIHEQQQKEFENKIRLARNTIAQGASDDEFQMFLALASKYDLDPFAKEIWCVKMNSSVVITTSRDGYLKIANRNSHYKGLDSDVVYSGDKFFKDEHGIHHAYNAANRGQIIGAYALVYRDDRVKPVYVFAPIKDYNKQQSPTWRQYPHAMILKVAESMALKRAFSVSGLTSYEEIGNQETKAQNSNVEQPQNSSFSQEERNTQINQLWHRYLAVCDNQQNHAKNAMEKITGKSSSKDFTDEDLKKLFEDVTNREYEQMNKELQAQNAEIQDADFQEA